MDQVPQASMRSAQNSGHSSTLLFSMKRFHPSSYWDSSLEPHVDVSQLGMTN